MFTLMDKSSLLYCLIFSQAIRHVYVKRIIRYQLAESRIASVNSIHYVQRRQAESKMEIVPLKHSCAIIARRLVSEAIV